MNAGEIIRDIVALVLRIDLEQVKLVSGDEPLNRIGMDSLNCMEIVVNIEEEFDISFNDEELLLDSLNSFNKLCGIVELKQSQHSLN